VKIVVPKKNIEPFFILLR